MKFDNYKEKYGELFVEQLELEDEYKRKAEEVIEALIAKAENSTEVTRASEVKGGATILKSSFGIVFENMRDFIEQSLLPKPGSKASYVSLIEQLAQDYQSDTNQLAGTVTFVTLSTMLDLTIKRNASLSAVCQQIATELWQEARTEAFLATSAYKKSIEKGIKERVQSSYKNAYVKALMNHNNFVYADWGKKEALTLAGSLVQIVLNSVDLFEQTNCAGYAEILPSQKLIDVWDTSNSWLVQHSYKYPPMVIPPKEWETVKGGGYYGILSETVDLLRLTGSRDVFSKSYRKKMAQLELNVTRKAVNAVQSTPWRINEWVLDVVKRIVDMGGGRAGIPYTEEPPKATLPEDPTEGQVLEYRKVMAKYYKNESRRKSLLIRALANIRTAERFKKYDRIYFPCNLDFRGRLYPIPSFNFQGDDLNKGLIELVATPPITDSTRAEMWLHVTGANLAGIDKVSYADRVQWVKDRHEDIMDIAKNPMGYTWWMDVDSPFQFLAWCKEYSRAYTYKYYNGSLEGFVSGLVVAFDGTCSGLQHFSAILRDEVGGSAVNLLPSDKPQDIYGIVAEKVNKVLMKDSMKGTEDTEQEDKNGNMYTKYGTKSLANIWLAYGVDRKVTKRSVMTLAYGSKEYGFREQILEDTIEPAKAAGSTLFDDNDFQAAGYMAKLIWNAVGKTVIAAVEGMKWLQACARKVTKQGQVVSWVTPTGLPVQQAYIKTKSKCYFSRCAGKQIRIYNNESTGEIDTRKQANGIAPNFIHSMDSSHLQLTVCKCVDKGIRHYAMIHDSYGTDLANAQTMYECVRRTFVDMYENDDVLENFKKDMQFLTDEQLPAFPTKGALKLEDVLKSDYIFC